ncbi:MAG TPA: DUF3857 domain-containing protein [Chitinophagaceae bacterium]
MKSILIATLLFLFIQRATAQTQLPPFGTYTASELQMKECDFDKGADAVILLDEASSNYDDDYELVTTRRIRIKILHDKGIDKGNIVIPFYSKDQFETIQNIEGETYNENQSPEVSALDRKSVYTERVNDYYSRKKFAMPNVKAGSIVEYKYESVMKTYGGLERWIFQSDIPTSKSCYLLQMIPSAEFSYSVSKKSNYDITITPKPDLGQVYFEMDKLPGLRFEPYMDAPKDYFQRVEFQLSGYVNRNGSKQSVNKTWRDIAYDLSTDREVGGMLKKDIPKADELKFLVEKETTNIGKVNAIYNYFKKNFTWDGINSTFANNDPKKIWEKRSGTSAELNLLLVSLFQSFDIDASPLLVAERDYGKVDPKLPFVDRFNKIVANVNADGKTFIIDGTQKFCPAGLTPSSLLNTYALVINKKTTDLVTLKANNEGYFSSAIINDTLEKNGLLHGSCDIKADQYAKQVKSESITDDQKAVIRKYEETNPGLGIKNFTYENLENDAEPLLQHLQFIEQFDQSGEFVLLNYNLFTGLAKNLFTQDERFTNVDFGYPIYTNIDETIELPENCSIEGIPANKKMVTPDGDISVVRQITQTGHSVHVQISF